MADTFLNVLQSAHETTTNNLKNGRNIPGKVRYLTRLWDILQYETEDLGVFIEHQFHLKAWDGNKNLDLVVRIEEPKY